MRTLLPTQRTHAVRIGLGLCILTGALLASTVQGAPRVDADPNKDYRIKPEAGPWVILAACYKGAASETLAKQLVLQVRQRDGLPAYYVNWGEKKRWEEEERLKRDRPHLTPERRAQLIQVEEEFGVLIGGYSDMESGRKALANVKNLKMPDLKVGPDQVPYDRTIDPQTGKVYAISPFAHAFVTRNPAIRQDAQAKGDDPFLKDLNATEQFSLLQNKKPYTLAVKEYYGLSNLQPRTDSGGFLDKIGLGKKSSDMLGASALQAHELARMLRAAPFHLEAYVLHTRKSSVVAVGGFNGLDDPEMQKMQQKLTTINLQPSGNAAPGAAAVLQLFSPAIAMRVPRP